MLRLFLAALALCAAPLRGQDYLEPAKPTLKEYDSRLRAVLREGFEQDVNARLLVVPSFQPERLTGLRRRGAAWEIFGLEPQKLIWLYEILEMMRSGQVQMLGLDGASRQSEEIQRLEATLPPHAADVGLTRCVAPVDETAASDILQAWKHMLSDIRESDEIGLDGVSYYFSMPADGRELLGRAWSPSEGSRVGQLVELRDAMNEYCKTKNRKQLRRISVLAHNVLTEE